LAQQIFFALYETSGSPMAFRRKRTRTRKGILKRRGRSMAYKRRRKLNYRRKRTLKRKREIVRWPVGKGTMMPLQIRVPMFIGGAFVLAPETGRRVIDIYFGCFSPQKTLISRPTAESAVNNWRWYADRYQLFTVPRSRIRCSIRRTDAINTSAIYGLYTREPNTPWANNIQLEKIVPRSKQVVIPHNGIGPSKTYTLRQRITHRDIYQASPMLYGSTRVGPTSLSQVPGFLPPATDPGGYAVPIYRLDYQALTPQTTSFECDFRIDYEVIFKQPVFGVLAASSSGSGMNGVIGGGVSWATDGSNTDDPLQGDEFADSDFDQARGFRNASWMVAINGCDPDNSAVGAQGAQQPIPCGCPDGPQGPRGTQGLKDPLSLAPCNLFSVYCLIR